MGCGEIPGLDGRRSPIGDYIGIRHAVLADEHNLHVSVSIPPGNSLSQSISTQSRKTKNTQLFTPGVVAVHENPKWYITKPFGYSWFPKELAPIPRSWAATTGKLIFYRQHDSGGHFAALEKPDVLLKDLEDFISEVWKR